MSTQQMNPKLLAFLIDARNRAKISTKKLSKEIGKSSAYISALENGRIKSISFDTVFEILKSINKRTYHIIGRPEDFKNPDEVLREFIVDKLGIFPDEMINRMQEEANASEKRKIEDMTRIQEKIDKLEMELIFQTEFEFIIDLALETHKVLEPKGFDEINEFKQKWREILKQKQGG